MVQQSTSTAQQDEMLLRQGLRGEKQVLFSFALFRRKAIDQRSSSAWPIIRASSRIGLMKTVAQVTV